MNKSTFFSGQPIFAQLLKFIPKDSIARIAHDSKADHYSKRFNTYEHLVTMLYSVFNNCNSLREITTGMLASEQRLAHLGVRYHPRRSTISDANIRRQAKVVPSLEENAYGCSLPPTLVPGQPKEHNLAGMPDRLTDSARERWLLWRARAVGIPTLMDYRPSNTLSGHHRKWAMIGQ